MVVNSIKIFPDMKNKDWSGIERNIIKFINVSCNSYLNLFYNIFLILGKAQICLRYKKLSYCKVCSSSIKFKFVQALKKSSAYNVLPGSTRFKLLLAIKNRHPTKFSWLCLTILFLR